jgi:SAM-dependent methyltransferase
MHQSSLDEMGRNLRELLKDRRGSPLRILDVGSRAVNRCFRHTYKEHMAPAWQYVGCDTDAGENVDVVLSDPYVLPMPADYFDVVISGQCLEHVPRPQKLVNEMARVLKPGGLMLLTAPWQWEIHRYPVDCWRILPDGMRVLLEDAGLKVIETYTREQDCWGIGLKA